jgi:hypothetical protein
MKGWWAAKDKHGILYLFHEEVKKVSSVEHLLLRSTLLWRLHSAQYGVS